MLKFYHQKLFAWFSIASLVLQIGSGIVFARPAFAEEPTPAPEATVTETPVNPEPPAEPTPPADQILTPTPQTTETITPTPTIEVSPTPTLTGLDLVTPTPTPTADATPPTDPTLAVLGGNQDSGDGLDIDPAGTDASSAQLNPSLGTDKADYAPTETVTITGSSFPTNTALTIRVTWPDGQVRDSAGEIGVTDTVTTGADGLLIYLYNLRGEGQPGEYLIEVLDSSGSVLVTDTFTDSLLCTNDVNGANDQPGQKDLTRMCFDKAVSPQILKFDWDEILGGGNNTYDGCSLWDTDGDGKANYSLCVQVLANPSTDIMEYNGFTLYSCGDDRSDRCSQQVNTVSAPGTSCTTTQAGDDPFPTGAAYPQDTVGTCNINPANFGAPSVLLNVCSFPSGQPNSDPSDCVAEPTGGFITVIKQANPNDGTAFNFNISGNSNYSFAISGSGQSQRYSVENGTYQVSETPPSGWVLDSASCQDSSANNVGTRNGNSITGLTIDSGDDITCTFADSLQQGTVIVHKDVQGPGGEAIVDTSQNFTVRLDGSDPQLFTDGGTVTYNDVASGAHTVSEDTPPTGYTLYSITPDSDSGTVGAQITVSPGQITDVYVINRQPYTKLTLTKTVNNDYGGTKQVADFILKIDGNQVTSGVANNVTPGLHTASEVSLDGYTASAWGGDCALDGTITLALGDDKTCTITNDDQPASLTVIKHVDNAGVGTASAGDFTMDVTGTEVSDPSFPGDELGTTVTLDAGSYSVSETGPTGYTAIYSTDCSGTIANGQSKTCTVTNTRDTGNLKALKIVDFGSVTDWYFSLNGGQAIQADSNGYVDFGQVATLVNHTLIESGPLGTFYLDSISGTNCTPMAAAPGANATVSKGGTTVCTFSNLVNKGSITIIKNAIPDDSQDFSFLTSGTGLVNFNLDDDADVTLSNTRTFSGLFPGAYTITESAATGWDPSLVICDSDKQISGTPGIGTASINLAAGENVTCTFANTKRGTIIIEKQTTPDGVVGSFVFTGDATGAISDNGQIIVNSLVPGTYTAIETDPTPSFNLTDISCDDGSSQTPSTFDLGARTATFRLDPGETIKCTFTNTQRGSITVDKVANPTNTGDEFNIVLSGDASDSIPLQHGENHTFANLLPGNYYLAEIYPPSGGWYLDWRGAYCSDGQWYEFDDPITLAAGESFSCTFNNTRDGKIIVEKQTNPDGDSQSFEFDPSYDSNFFLTDGQQDDSGWLTPGTYSVSEIVPAGWDLNNPSCISSIGDTEVNTALELDPGETITCTFTNTKQGTIIVKKDMAGGTDTFDFTGTPNGSISTDLGTIQASVVPGQYTSTEGAKTGWDLNSIICDDGNSTGDVATRIATFNVEAGETITCTFTNTKRAHIIIQKDAITDSSQQFVFNNNFGNGNPATFNLTDDSTLGLPSYDAEVLPGTYSVSENAVAGWESPESTSCTDGSPVNAIEVSPGETVTCTFVNEKLATINLVKNTVGGDDTFDFVMTGTGLPTSAQLITSGGTANQTFNNLDPDNTYTITETPIPAGWANTSAACDNGDPVDNITPNAGEIITCTFTNNKPAAQIDLTPLTATNKIGDDHIITATVQVHNGDGSWGSASDGTVVIFSITNSNGATADFVGGNTCITLSGFCSVTINSPTTGNVSIDASASPVVLGVTLSVSTGTDGDNSADATKDYVNAKIGITPSSYTNEVGDGHDFIVTVSQDTGSGFVPVEGAVVNAIAIPTPDGGLDVTDCNAGTDASGQCTVTINSSVAGTFTIAARSTITVNTVEFKLQTNGNDGNSGPATKTYVDAKILITPDRATNNIGQAHTITATVTEDPGTGPVAAGGELVTFSLLNNAATANFVGDVDTCTTDASGQCSVQINTTAPGSVDIHATVDVGVGGLTLTRATDSTHGSSGDANKVYQAGKIIVVKQTDPAGDSQSFEFDPSYDSNFFLTDDQQKDSGWLAPDSYSVTEIVPSVGWDLDLNNTSCDDGSLISAISLQAGETVTCTFTNTKRGSIGDFVWEDLNSDTIQDVGEPGIGGVVVNLYLDDGDGIFEPGGDDGLPIATDTTDGVGGYLFDNLVPGDYWVDVDGGVPAGYTLTTANDPLTVELVSGESEEGADFGYTPEPSITIAKTNDHSGGGTAGDTVNYTLTLTNGSVPLLVDVVDVMPAGFTYVVGSGKVGINASEPTVAGSILTWNDISFSAGEVIDITYQAKIDNNQPAGTYYNLATCRGMTRGEETINCGIVNSSVPIGQSVSTSTSIGGTVLGVAAVLGAATGSPTWLLILALMLIFAGFSLRFWDNKRKVWLLANLKTISKKLAIFAAVAVLFFAMAKSAQAVTEVRIANLPEYERTDNFKVYYTALNTDNPSSVSVTAQVRKEGGFDWKGFGGTKTDPSGYFETFGYTLDGDGTYHFKVEANGITSGEISTIVDRSGPDRPTEYRKDREGSTAYRIYWKNPGNDDYAMTRIFASQTQNFTADDSTKKADVGGSKNQELNYLVTGLEPDKEYFFALQGFDKAGNGSGLVGDGGSVTYETTSAPTQAVLGTVGEVKQLPEEEGTGTGGEILGGATEEVTPTPAGIVGEVGKAVSQITGGGNRGKVLLGLGLGILAAFAYFLYRRRSS